jgi:hypothetical protein
MKTTKIICVLFTLGALCAFGQTATTTAAFTTSVFVGLGGEYNHYSNPALAASILELGVCGSKVCSITTIEMQDRVSTVRTGFGYLLKKSGKLSLYGTMDAGATFGLVQATSAAVASAVALGNLGGGLRVRYDLGGAKLAGHVIPAGFGVVAGVRMAAVAGTSVQPEYMASMSFRWQ